MNIRDPQDRTSLMHAAVKDHTDCVESLIHTWGADVNAMTRRNDIDMCRTTLTYAVEKNHHQCMEILIQAGADVNVAVNYKPLMMATAASQCESMRRLIRAELM